MQIFHSFSRHRSNLKMTSFLILCDNRQSGFVMSFLRGPSLLNRFNGTLPLAVIECFAPICITLLSKAVLFQQQRTKSLTFRSVISEELTAMEYVLSKGSSRKFSPSWPWIDSRRFFITCSFSKLECSVTIYCRPLEHRLWYFKFCDHTSELCRKKHQYWHAGVLWRQPKWEHYFAMGESVHSRSLNGSSSNDVATPMQDFVQNCSGFVLLCLKKWLTLICMFYIVTLFCKWERNTLCVTNAKFQSRLSTKLASKQYVPTVYTIVLLFDSYTVSLKHHTGARSWQW